MLISLFFLHFYIIAKFQELTEEGLPFLILFHHPDDTESVKIFTREVQNQLLDDRSEYVH